MIAFHEDRSAIEVVVGPHMDLAAVALDLLEDAGGIGDKGLARFIEGRARTCLGALPGLSIGLPAHVGKRVQPILRLQRHGVDGFVSRVLPLRRELPLESTYPSGGA